MKIFANKEIKKLFLAVSVIWVASLLLTQGLLWLRYQQFSLFLLLVSISAGASILAVCYSYFRKQNQVMEQAVSQINAYLDGNRNARIECDYEGELYRLFHSVNSLAAVLNAHADNELREKEFLKNTISDISHQLKTPLAALNIYNGLLQDENMEASSVKEFADLSEQELDRIEILVQNLLKITRLDAGAIVLEKTAENVADMMRDVELHFAYRARQEKKEIILTVIEAAAGGDVEAINAVLKHYAGYIARLSMRELYDEYGNPHLCVDEELRRRLETKLITKLLTFRVN